MSGWAWLFLAGFAWFVWIMVKPAKGGGRSATAAPPAQASAEYLGAKDLREAEDVEEVELVGESHCQAHLLATFGPKTEDGIYQECDAILSPERTNRHDAKAVQCTIRGGRVGYLSRDDARDFHGYLRRLRAQMVVVKAEVRGGWKRGADEGHVGVVVALPEDWRDS